MNEFLNTGEFPSDGANVANARSNGDRFERANDAPFNDDMPTGRRTPNRRAF